MLFIGTADEQIKKGANIVLGVILRPSRQINI
jgi:hypothetical protein